MAEPLSYAAFISVLRSTGRKVIEEKTDGKSPSAHHRPGKWGPVHGVMIHHTVTSGHDHTVDLCRRGYSGLPGPLCHGVICKAGHIHVVGYGRANHAGLGDRDVFNAVLRESYATRPPAPNGADMDFNPHFYGFECENKGDGKDPWPAEQLATIDAVSAALCKKHGWNERSVIGHLEAQPGKVDPRGFAMTTRRAAVKALLAGTPPAQRPPAETKDQEQDRRLAALEKRVDGMT